MRPLGTVKFRSMKIEMRHAYSNPGFHWSGKSFDIPDDGVYGVRYPNPNRGELYRRGDGIQPIQRGLFANARVGDARKNMVVALKWSWEIAPKAVEADDKALRIWVLPHGEHYIVDGTRVGVEFLLTRDVQGDEWPVLERYYNPVGVLVDPNYTKRTRAFGDFGAFIVQSLGNQRTYRSDYKYGWVGFGDGVRNTHATGSPRNRYSYLLAYYQSGQPGQMTPVEEQVFAHKQRPYHWSNPDRRFDMTDYRGDHLFEGPFHMKYDGPGATARKKIPPKIAAHAAQCDYEESRNGKKWTVKVPCDYGFTGYDPEHFTIDDLRDYYRATHDPTALSYLMDMCEGILSINEIRGTKDALHSARVLGWCLRGLLDGYRISGEHDFWLGATKLVSLAIERDGQRRIWKDGVWAGWNPFSFRGKVKHGLTNYDHFKGWMSAVGGYALYLYLDVLDARIERGQVAPFADVEEATAFRKRVHKLTVDTADLIMELSYLPGRGFIYQTSLYDDGMTDPQTGKTIAAPVSLEEHLTKHAQETSGFRHYDGVATWNAEFLALAAARENNRTYLRPVRETLAARRQDRLGIASNPWYQVSIETEASFR